MIYVNHRINTIEQLSKVPHTNGIELDIRYHEQALVLHHDPFHHPKATPILFEDLLKAWRHSGPMILNVKTEGIELKCIELMQKYQIRDWFFLDLSMPYFVLYANKAQARSIEGFNTQNLAVRFSEFEPIEYALAFKNKAQWVWVDCFTTLPLTSQNYRQLKDAGFKVCIVSPELQKHPMTRINEFRQQLMDTPIDAVCTKRPDLWGQALPAQTIKQLEQDYPIV